MGNGDSSVAGSRRGSVSEESGLSHRLYDMFMRGSSFRRSRRSIRRTPSFISRQSFPTNSRDNLTRAVQANKNTVKTSFNAVQRIASTFIRNQKEAAQEELLEALHKKDIQNLKPALMSTAETELECLISAKRYKPPAQLSLARFLPESLKPQPVPATLRFAEYAGSKMIWSFLYPTLPKIVADSWILSVFIVKLILLILFATVYDDSIVHRVTISFLVITLVLSIIDGCLYYLAEGSMFESIRWCQHAASHDSENRCDCTCSWRSRFPAMEHNPIKVLPRAAQSFLVTRLEIVRTLISQIILHILLLTFLIIFNMERPYTDLTVTNNVIYAVFIIGIILYIFQVYFLRLCMIICSIVSLKRLPKTTNNDYLKFMNRVAWVVGGNVVFLAVFVYMVATRLRAETCIDPVTGVVLSVNYQAPFVYVMIASSLLPMLSLGLYFIMYYQTVKSLYTAFYIDITAAVTSKTYKSLLDLPNDEPALAQAADISLKGNQIKIRDDYEKHLFSITFPQRLGWFLSNPIAIFGTSFYIFLVTMVFAAMAVGFSACDDFTTVRLIFDDTALTVAFFIGLVTVIVTNISVILAGVISLVLLAVIASLIVIVPVVALIFSPVIFVALFIYLSTKEKRSTVV